jgi:AcrR family transcriptional regulator
VARSADPQHRSDLLERIVDYVETHGLADLSLRPLAEGVGSSARVLLYFFGSKEELVSEIIAAARLRQRAMFSTLPRDEASFQTTLLAGWRAMSAPPSEPIMRLFFEIYGMALQQPARFPAFLRGVVEDWLPFMSQGAVADGFSETDARALATIMLASFRGFMLDVLTTGDRVRVDRAVELFVAALDGIPTPKELAS